MALVQTGFVQKRPEVQGHPKVDHLEFLSFSSKRRIIDGIVPLVRTEFLSMFHMWCRGWSVDTQLSFPTLCQNTNYDGLLRGQRR